MLPWVHPSPQPKRHLDRFSHFAQLTGDCAECPYTSQWATSSPLKLPLAVGTWTPTWCIIPWDHPTPQPIWHLDRSIRFCRAHDCGRPTDKPVGFYGPTAPPGQNAPSSECPPNVVPNSEFRTCPDPEFPNALHSEFMNAPNVGFLNVPHCSAPMSYLAGSKWGRPLCYAHAAARWCLQQARGCRVHICVMATGADFKIYLPHQFCSNRVKFFYNRQETQTQKTMDQNFDIRILWFLRIFWNFQKGVTRSLCGRSGPLCSKTRSGPLSSRPN